MLLNVGCMTSECGMESLISSMGETNSHDRPISIEQLKREMIRKNGPHPLHPATKKFLFRALSIYFGGGPGKWNFTKTNTTVEASKVINRLCNSVPEPKLD